MGYFKYLTIPYVDKGSTFKGCDCYGLVLLFLKEELKIELTSLMTYYSITDFDTIEKQVKIESEKFKKITHIKDLLFGDVLVFKVQGKFNAHCGIYLGENFLHTRKGVGVSKCTFYHEYWLSRFSFALRIKDEI